MTDTFKILSIDPGTVNQGYGLIEAEVQSLKLVKAMAWTVDASKFTTNEDADTLLYGPRFSRVRKHGLVFKHYLQKFDPLIVVCEAPFYNPRRPEAFSALLETIFTIRHQLYVWDRCMKLETIDPSSAKKSIGVSGISGDKSLIKSKLLQIDEFIDAGVQDFDEHSADALLIGKCFLDRLRQANL